MTGLSDCEVNELVRELRDVGVPLDSNNGNQVGPGGLLIRQPYPGDCRVFMVKGTVGFDIRVEIRNDTGRPIRIVGMELTVPYVPEPVYLIEARDTGGRKPVYGFLDRGNFDEHQVLNRFCERPEVLPKGGVREGLVLGHFWKRIDPQVVTPVASLTIFDDVGFSWQKQLKLYFFRPVPKHLRPIPKKAKARVREPLFPPAMLEAWDRADLAERQEGVIQPEALRPPDERHRIREVPKSSI